MASEEIIDLLKEQGQRLFDMADCGYAEAFAKAMNGYDLEAKDVAMIENYKNETKKLVSLVEKLEKVGKSQTNLGKNDLTNSEKTYLSILAAQSLGAYSL